MSVRLNKVMRELNMGIPTIVDYLMSIGVTIDNPGPNTKISEEQFELLKEHFGKELLEANKSTETLFNNMKMRLIGYYSRPNQTMNPESEKVTEAEELAKLLESSIQSLYENPDTDEEFKSIIKSPTVFVFKNEEGNLFAYFTEDKTARITDVVFNRRFIKQVSFKYKAWFIPGQKIVLINYNGEEPVEGTNKPSARSNREFVKSSGKEFSTKDNVNNADETRVRRFLRLKDNYFIGQFIPIIGGYKIVDIRNTDFTKIEDTERNIRNLEINFKGTGYEFKKYAYYKFAWKLKRTEPLHFDIDLSYDVEIQSPEDIVRRIAHCLEDYPMDAARKITRNLDTLSKQLTQSGKEVFIYELLQNANDYPKKNKDNSIPVDVEFHILDDYLVFQHSGEYFNAKNVAAICNINDGEKNTNVEAIGYKGIGFKTVFLDSDYVYLQTGTFSFRFDRESGTSDEVPINTPWQIYPFWTSYDEVSNSIKRIFKMHPNDEFRVKFALKPRNSDILKDRSRKDNYIDLFTNVFETERVILFIPNIHQVSVFFGNSNTPKIVRSKDNDTWCVSEALTSEVPEPIQERINDVLTNNDADKSDGYDKIPEKYLNFKKTAVRFACKKEGRKLLPVENAILYCYLPAKRANWGFDFLMNTDMVPNGARDDIEDIELNHEIAKIAGKQFFYWIKSLIDSGDYELDSIFSLIPDFDTCKERHQDYKKFIEEFQEEFEALILEESFVPVVNQEGDEYLTTIDNIINDQTGVTKCGVMNDSDFMIFMALNNYYLPVQELRESEAFAKFLYKHSPRELDINFDLLRKKCARRDVMDWLKDADNNNRFLNHLLLYNQMENFADEKIFIEYEGDLYSAGSLYRDFDTHCGCIPFLRRFIPHLADSTRNFFKDNEDWNTFAEQYCMEFKADEMLDEYIFGCKDAIALLENIENSKSFFKFIAQYSIDLTGKKEEFPYIDEDGEVYYDFDGLTYFFNDEIYKISKETWIGDNTIRILSHEYLEADNDGVIKDIFLSLGFQDFDESDFIQNSIVSDEEFRYNINNAIDSDFEANVAFVKYVYSAKEYLKEKEGLLKDYLLRCFDTEDSEVYINADNTRYFSQDSYAGNTTFADNKEHSWLSFDDMYYLDNTYFEQFPDEERKPLESFFRQTFGIKTFTNKSFFSDVVIANKKTIFNNLLDEDLLKDFIGYLKRDEDDIFDDNLAFNDIKDIPILCYDGTIISKRDTARLIEYDEAAVELFEKDWCPLDIFVVVDKSYSDFKGNTLQLLKVESFNRSVVMTDISENDKFKSYTQVWDYNIDFWRYIKAYMKSFNNLELFKDINFVSEDGSYLLGPELYISDIYQKDGIENIVKKYDNLAEFVSHEYLEDDSENEKPDWYKLFKKCGLKSDNKDILFNSVIPKLSEIENDAVIAMLTKHLKDIKEVWQERLDELRELKVRTRSGRYKTLDETIIIDITEENVVEPFKNVELQGEIAPEILAANKEVILLIAEEFSENCIYRSKQDWAQAKLDEYIESIQPDKDKRETINVEFVRELATLISNDFVFNNSSIEELLYKSKDENEEYLPANKLTLGAIYKPTCDFESNGINDICYLSENYLTENNKDTIRNYFKNYTEIHQSFEKDDISLLKDRAFALYFWGKYFTRRVAEFEEWIEDGEFNDMPCIPSEEDVVSPEELYSPEIFHFARNTPDWQNKVPAKSVVDSIREGDARNIFYTLPFKKELSFEDCLHYLLLAKDNRYGEDYKNRKTIIDWIISSEDRDDSLMSWYREQPNATWRNGKGQFVHIKDLYVIHPDAKQERNIFSGDEHVMGTSMFPIDIDKFEEACDILQIKCLRSSDFRTIPNNPRDETVEILKSIMPKFLVLSAIEKPEKYQALFEKYATELKNYRFLVCDYIDLGYESIHNDIERIYSDDNHIYYVESWIHPRTYTKFCSKLKGLLGIDVYTNVYEDVLFNTVSIEKCIEKYCSSLMYDEAFRKYLQDLNQDISKFEYEYIPEEEEEEEYYSSATDKIQDSKDTESEEEISPDMASEHIKNPLINKEESDTNEEGTISNVDKVKAVKSQEEKEDINSSIENDFKEQIIKNTITEDEEGEEGEDISKQQILEESTNDEESKTHTPGDVEGHHRNGTWVDEYWREDGTHVSGHWRSETEVSPHTREINTPEEKLDSGAAIVPDVPSPVEQVHAQGYEEFLGSIDNDREYDYLGQSPQKPRARKLAKPFTREEIERMRSHGTPLELESLPPTNEEIDVLAQCGISVEQIADTNYLAQLRLYNNLVDSGEMPAESREEFVKNANDVTIHKLKDGGYIHTCSAARGVMYISPSVWNKMMDNKWKICVYLDGRGKNFHYINNAEDFLKLVVKDDVVIKITGKEKVEVVKQLYKGILGNVRGTAYTLIRVASRTNMDAVFAHYGGCMAEPEDGNDTNEYGE